MGRSTTAAAERTRAPQRTRSFVASCSLRMQRSERRSSHGVANLARVRYPPVGPPLVGAPSPLLDALLHKSRDEAYAALSLRLQAHNFWTGTLLEAQGPTTALLQKSRDEAFAAFNLRLQLPHFWSGTLLEEPTPTVNGHTPLDEHVWNGPAGRHYRRQVVRTNAIGGGRSTSPITVDGTSDFCNPTNTASKCTTARASISVSTALALPPTSLVQSCVSASTATHSWSVHPLMAPSSRLSNVLPAVES